jgi:hypothetical protein
MAELRIQLRRGTAAQWTSSNPVLGEAEFGIETDTLKFKVGNGTTPWNEIVNYFEPVDLSEYVTLDQLATDLEDYVATSDLTTTLSDYLTTASASSTYQTQAAMSLYAALSGATFTGEVILNADPTAPLGAATKQYVDNIATGLQTKPAVKAATTGNISGTYDNGADGVGATLNLGQLASLDIDGVTDWDQYDGILLKDQTDATENGRWVIYQIGNDTDTDWILRRCGLCDEPSEIPGAYMFVSDGDTNAGTGWVLTVADASTFVVGTDDITANNFTASATYTAGTGLNLSSGEFSIDSTVATLTGTQTLTNKTLTLPDINSPIIRMPIERMEVLASGGQPNVFLGTTGNNNVSVHYVTLPASTVVAFYADNTSSPSQSAVTFSIIVEQTSTPRSIVLYIGLNAGATVDLTSSIQWLDSVVPTPEASTTSVFTFSILKDGDGTSISHYKVLGSMTTYGA